jgi:hypothetical protein
MSDEPFYSPNAKPRPPRQPKPGELLVEFQRADGTPMTCERRDYDEFGTEAQLLLNGQFYIARTFRDDPSLQVKGRAPGDRLGRGEARQPQDGRH